MCIKYILVTSFTTINNVNEILTSLIDIEIPITIF